MKTNAYLPITLSAALLLFSISFQNDFGNAGDMTLEAVLLFAVKCLRLALRSGNQLLASTNCGNNPVVAVSME